MGYALCRLSASAMRTGFTAVFVLAVYPTFALCQAPIITPDGDPSVADESIYQLVVSPDEYPGYSYVVLFDDLVARVDRDGTSRATYRQVAQVLTQDGAELWGEHALSYDSTAQRIAFNWVRVLWLDGTVLSSAPRHEQELSDPTDFYASVYTDNVIRRIILAGVAPGTIVDLSYTIETFDPAIEGDFRYRWVVNQLVPVRRSRFLVDLPAAVTPRIRETNLDFERQERMSADRRTFEWSTSDLAAIEAERFLGSPNDVVMVVRISSDMDWDDVAGWYANLARGRSATDPQIESALAEQLDRAWTLSDSIRAVHRWVAQDFRYVALGLGVGGYQPRYASEVFESKFGDCKDKTALFISALTLLGVNAYPVLVNLEYGIDSLMPSMTQFDHAIAVIERRGGLEFADLTSPVVPYGQLPYSLQGEAGLLVRPGGTGEIVQLPVEEPAASLKEVIIGGELSEDGTLTGWMTLSTAGTEQPPVRELLGRLEEQTDEDIVDVGERIALSYFDRAVVDSTRIGDGYDLSTDPIVTVWMTVDDVVTRSGTRLILPLPLPAYASPSLVDELEADEERRFPIDVEVVNGPSRHRTELLLTLPAGWRAELPQDIEIEGTFGYYRALYSQQGRMLRVMREIAGRRGLEPPDSISALIDWFRQLSEDRAKYIVIEEATGVTAADSLEAVRMVALEFVWPVGMRAGVTRRRINTLIRGDTAADTTTVEATYQMRVREHAEGLLIAFSDFQLASELDDVAPSINSLIPQLSSMMPGYVVSPEGDLLGLEDFQGFIEKLRSLMQPLLDSAAKEVPGVEDLMQRVLTEEFFYASVLEEWGPLVNLWSGMELEVGVTYNSEADEPSPLYPEVLIPFDYTHTLESRVPCTAGRADSACVLLTFTSRPDPDALDSLMRKIFGEMLQQGDVNQPFVTDYGVQNVMSVITEPGSLIPHRLETTQRVIVTVEDTLGNSHVTERIERNEYDYRYGDVLADVPGEDDAPLIAAAAAGDLNEVVELLDADVEVDARGEDGVTALMAAARQGHEDVVRFLLYSGAQVDATDRAGNTAMLIAATRRHERVIRRLMEAGASVDRAFQSARERGMISAVPTLLAVGAAGDTLPADVHLDSGLVLYNDGELEAARAEFFDAFAADTARIESLAWMAEAQRRLGNHIAAVEAARAAVAAEPCHAMAHATLAQALNPQYGDWPGADASLSWQHLQEAIECDPEDGNAWLAAVLGAMERNDRSLEIRALERLVQTGFLTPATLASARWLLNAAPTNAVLVTAGDLDTYPLLALQVTEGLRTDVVVANAQVLNLQWYIDVLADRYGVLNPRTDPDRARRLLAAYAGGRASMTLADTVMAVWRAANLLQETDRPVAFAMTTGDPTIYAGSGELVMSGAYFAVANSSWQGPADPGIVLEQFESIDPRDFRGPSVSADDRSPVRRNQSHPAMMVLLGAAYYAGLLEESDWLAFSNEELEQLRQLLVWLEEFARVAVPDLYEVVVQGIADEYVNLSHAYWSRSEFETAVEHVREALSRDETNLFAIRNLGYISLRLSDLDTAVVYLTRADSVGTSLPMMLNLADAYRLLGRVDAALHWRQKAEETTTGENLETASYMLGPWVYNYMPLYSGDSATIVQTVRIAETEEKLAVMRYGLSIDYALSGDVDEAAVQWKIAAALTSRPELQCFVLNSIVATRGHHNLSAEADGWLSAKATQLGTPSECGMER